MGGPTGEAYVSTLNATGLSKEETLARESIQNSSDSSATKTSKVSVKFRRVVLKGAALRKFVDALSLDQIRARHADKLLGLSGGTILERLEKKDCELPLLFVEDFGTCGLFGDPHDPGSHFYRLLLSLGDSAKSRENNDSGGSYGFGKAAYFLNSRIHTIVAHSSFKTESGEFESRLFGCGFFTRHLHSAKSHTGRAWFGIRRADTESLPVVDPARDQVAAIVAESLGFSPRNEVAAQGTSILIVDSNLKLDDLLSGIETWWWPRLLEHDIDIEVIDENNVTSYPRPKKRDDLRPFMDAYQIANKRVEPVRPHQKFEEFNRIEQLSAGSLGLTMLSPEQESALDESQKNAIALIRGPRMVVAYHQISSNAPSVAGCFVGASDAETFLKLSEPPAHNVWDPQADRLSANEGQGSRIVRSILNRIKQKARDFQNAATPPAPPRPNKLQRLERMLGKYFMMRDKIGPKPEVEISPVHLTFSSEPMASPLEDGSLQMSAKFEVRLKDDGPESLQLKLQVNCSILENEHHEGDALSFQLTEDGVKIEKHPTTPNVWTFDLEKAQRARFIVQSSSYDPNWSLRFKPEVMPA